MAAETEEADTERQRRKAESDVESVRARAERDQSRLDSGAVASARELESLQHEIGSLARRQAELEDIELEVMERLESVQERLQGLRAERETVAADLGTTEQRRDVALQEIDAEVAAVSDERAGIAGGLPGDLLTLFEKLRGQHGGVGAAALNRRRCEGCRLEINPTDLNRFRDAPDDEVLRCEECRRILVRTSESGL